MDPQPGAPAAAKTKKKPNSPKAPGISLRSAMAEGTKLYLRYSHGTFGRGEMASALDMSASSGAFMGKAATLKDYGLVEEAGGSSKVSDLFKAIFSAPAGSGELKRNALQAIRQSSVFAGLLQQFASKIPEEAVLALRLENHGGFNRDRAVAVASAFRSSLADYGLIDGSGNVLPVRDEAPGAEADRRSAAEEPDEKVDLPVGSELFRIEVPLGAGRKAVLALPDDLVLADTNKICAVLKAYTLAM